MAKLHPIYPYDHYDDAVDQLNYTIQRHVFRKFNDVAQLKFELSKIVRRAFITIPTPSKTNWIDRAPESDDATRKVE